MNGNTPHKAKRIEWLTVNPTLHKVIKVAAAKAEISIPRYCTMLLEMGARAMEMYPPKEDGNENRTF